MLGRRRSLSESPPSSDSKDSRRKRRKRISSSSSDSSDNEDEEMGHWKSRNGYRNQEGEDMSRPWRRQKILADFIIEKPDTDVAPPRIKVKLHEPWILFTDGSSCVDRSGAGLILTNPEGMEFTYALRFEFTATNNEAEYEALIAGLCIATRMGARNLEANVDSRLVANHVLGKYVAKEDNMVQYLDKTKSLIQGFDRFTIKQVPRSENKKADALSKIASTSFAHLSKQVLVEILKNKSISEMEISTVIEEQNPTQTTYYERFTRVHGICTQDHGGLKFLIVAIDYFTKWIEAKAVATITDWCAKLNITQHFASVKHPQTNGLVERANRSLGEGIKARLDKHKGRWVEELSHVLWAHRTTIKVSTRDTPFSLVYGTEVVIPAEIGMPTIRTAEVNVATNDDERRIDLDLLEERRKRTAICEAKAKSKMKGYYDAK
nr:reverse transcriptase domain-containing protein [Tanacetum cinerariifolium]